MVSLLDIVVDSTMVIILFVVIITGSCAVYIAFCQTRGARTPLLTCNKYVVPGFPCDGTLMLMARDGVMYVVPEGKAVVKTDAVVREVHGGRVAQSCDQHGRFAYVDRYDYDDEPYYDDDDQEEKQNAIDHVFNNWAFDSPRSQDMTVSVTTNEDSAESCPESALAGEMVTNEGLMI